MLLEDLAETSRRVAETSARGGKIAFLAECLGRASPEEAEIAIAMLSGELRQGRIGVGWAAVRDVRDVPPAAEGTLAVREVDAVLAEIAAIAGRGAPAERMRRLRALLARATAAEQAFLARLLLGELRQGAEGGVMVDAIAKAARVPAAAVRRAAMLGGDLAAVGRAALVHGETGLAAYGLEPLRPLQPMLAQTAEGVGDALAQLGAAAFEHKLDGARVQVHRAGDEVRVFTRELNDVTARAPEVVEVVRALPVRQIVLDGEVIALRADGRPEPFQRTMQRFGRKLEVEKMRAELPLSAFFFDVVHVDGVDLLDRPAAERAAALADRVPAAQRVPRIVPATAEEAQAFLDDALARGHEGVMAKSLDAPYEAGRRGASWLKIKPAHTLDLVVLAVERGSGRRSRWLSNLHLGARDPRTGGFVMLGKTFKGLSDAMLEWQTGKLEELAVSRDEWVVWVRPELVVEIAFDGVQTSSHYPGGLALRFARVKRHRPEKSASEADTIDTVRAIHARANG